MRKAPKLAMLMDKSLLRARGVKAEVVVVVVMECKDEVHYSSREMEEKGKQATYLLR